MILCKCTSHACRKAQGTLHEIIKNIVNNIVNKTNKKKKKQKSCVQNDSLSKEDAGPQFLPLNCQAAWTPEHFDKVHYGMHNPAPQTSDKSGEHNGADPART